MVPNRSWWGVHAPVAPRGMRCGFSKGDRWPSARLGRPGFLLGSAGTDSWACPRRALPNAMALVAVARTVRRETFFVMLASLPCGRIVTLLLEVLTRLLAVRRRYLKKGGFLFVDDDFKPEGWRGLTGGGWEPGAEAMKRVLQGIESHPAGVCLGRSGLQGHRRRQRSQQAAHGDRQLLVSAADRGFPVTPSSWAPSSTTPTCRSSGNGPAADCVPSIR